MTKYRRFAPVALLALAIAMPFILSGDYMRHLLVLSIIFAILALSWDIIMGYMGQFSFGHAAFFGLGGYTSALLTVKAGVPVWLGFLAGIACAAAAGFIIGAISLRTRGLYLAIVTLGFGMVLWMIAINWIKLTGGMDPGLPGVPPPVIDLPLLPKIAFRSALLYYYLALAFLLFTIYLVRSFLCSRPGRAVIALRENEGLANSVGIVPFKYYLLAFTLATGLAGFAGAAHVHYLHFANPSTFGMHYMFIILIVVFVGGTGTIGGPILGSFVFIFAFELLRISLELREVLFGVILLVCVLFMPRGIYPSLVFIWNRFITRRQESG